MFHRFFRSLARSKYLSLFSFSFISTFWFAETAKSTIRQALYFLLIMTRFGLLADVRWSVYKWKSQRILCISFSWMDSSLCLYHQVVWSNFHVLHNSQWITFPTQSCLVLYTFWVVGWLVGWFYGVSTLLGPFNAERWFWWKFVCFKVFVSSNIYSWCTLIFRYWFVFIYFGIVYIFIG